MSDNNKQGGKPHEDCEKFALNENGVLGIIMDVVSLGNKSVYLGITVDSDDNWASLKPRIVSGKLRPENLMEVLAHTESMPKSNPKMSAKIMYVNPPTGGSKASTSDFLQDLLSGLNDSIMFNGPSMQPPKASDFEIDDPEEGNEKPHPEDDGA